MSEVIIDNEAQYRASRAIACHWGPDWLAETPQPQELSAVTLDSPIPALADVPDAEAANEAASDSAEPLAGDFGFADYSEWCWSQVSAGDYRYLKAPRNYPSPCPWCCGRLVHNRLCDELRRSWRPTLPFGKHKGKPLSDVPGDYLEWLAAADGIDSELRDAIRLHLQSE